MKTSLFAFLFIAFCVSIEHSLEMEVVKQEMLSDYQGEIVLKLLSKDDTYYYMYSLDDGKHFIPFAKTESNLVLCKGYIGTNIGIYTTSNGNPSKEYADFDWISYKGFPRLYSRSYLTHIQ